MSDDSAYLRILRLFAASGWELNGRKNAQEAQGISRLATTQICESAASVFITDHADTEPMPMVGVFCMDNRGKFWVSFFEFFEEFPGPLEFQAVFFQLPDEQRRAELDRPTRCRQIHKGGSAPPNLRPVFSQPATLQSVVKFDMPTGSGINTVGHKP